MGGTRKRSLNFVSEVCPVDFSVIACSLVVRGGQPAQRLRRWNEVIGAADRCRIPGQGITDAILCSGHAGQAPLVAAEAETFLSHAQGRRWRRLANFSVSWFIYAS